GAHDHGARRRRGGARRPPGRRRAPRPAAQCTRTPHLTSPTPEGAPMTSPVVEVSHLRKTYPGAGRSAPPKNAVADVSFQVAAGEIFGILGPNGAGKTTTVECLAGLRHADGGSVRVLGRDPQADPTSVREDVG